MDPEEVMAYTWFTPEVITKLRKGEEDCLDVFVLEDASTGKLRTETLEISSMFKGGALLWTSGEVYSGTQQALTRWCISKKGSVVSKI